MDQKTPNKKPYEVPTVQACGNLVDLTNTGATRVGGDLKNGSVLSPGQ